MRAFNKVASLMGLTAQAAAMPAAEAAPTAGGAIALGPGNCVVAQCVRTCIIQDCINECGGGAPGGGFFGGFGGLGG